MHACICINVLVFMQECMYVCVHVCVCMLECMCTNTLIANDLVFLVKDQYICSELYYFHIENFSGKMLLLDTRKFFNPETCIKKINKQKHQKFGSMQFGFHHQIILKISNVQKSSSIFLHIRFLLPICNSESYKNRKKSNRKIKKMLFIINNRTIANERTIIFILFLIRYIIVNHFY